MPEVSVAQQRIRVAPASNLLDSLLAAGVPVAHSCRAGSCHACMVRCVGGVLVDAQSQALSLSQREQGWRLACQCQVQDDVSIELFDPIRDAQSARVHSCDWLSEQVLRLRLQLQRPLRYSAGQYVQLWIADDIARPYSLASLAGEDPWLELHIDCAANGAFTSRARHLQAGDSLAVGELRGAALHYDPQWQAYPLWLLAAGTGLAPLYAVLREALRQEHSAPIHLLHVARSAAEHYLREELEELARQYPQLQLQYCQATELAPALAQLRLVSRQTRALLCGAPERVEEFSRRLYLAGLPRNQIFADLYLPRAR
ncbi:iron-sulfur-binding ferredoxin reductase [Pseudomonas sp. 5P_3.1_Bac2]|uniref:iron-sulfur-binding ferredoxin reductase n=1 Tax=Pseudomonas sp. 5P_3.1_Bac2 TaxID=2971617 RepID=UPI0021CA7BF0|nr:iron-sulfur-binding ferredoxin reductase [Pseudomonas sp. 5P_3.1_Bac2]MCU1718843.1 iron-sulfur-binding ferredoxin reductase [Pseudomonas sp. 5P_3.1_Bac2]